jgi:hypothetical protein
VKAVDSPAAGTGASAPATVTVAASMSCLIIGTRTAPPEPHRAGVSAQAYDGRMCRNITTLRGLEPLATSQEIEAAARQYVRKISGVQKTSPATEAAFERAVMTITQASTQLLRELPPRKQPPPTLPPLRRIALAKAATVTDRLTTAAP